MLTYTTAIIHAFSPSKHVLGDQLTHAHIHYSYYLCFQPLKTCTRWSTNSCSLHYSYYPCFQPLKTCTRWSTNSCSCIHLYLCFTLQYYYLMPSDPSKHVLGDQLTHGHIQLLSSYYRWCFQPLKTCTRWSTNSWSHTLQLLSMLSAPQNMYSVIN